MSFQDHSPSALRLLSSFAHVSFFDGYLYYTIMCYLLNVQDHLVSDLKAPFFSKIYIFYSRKVK